MITEAETVAIKRAIRRLVRAEIDHSWMGSQDAIYHADIESELRSAKAALANLLSTKTQKPKHLGPVDEEPLT
jgi:hypothetical protein